MNLDSLYLLEIDEFSKELKVNSEDAQDYEAMYESLNFADTSDVSSTISDSDDRIRSWGQIEFNGVKVQTVLSESGSE